MVGDALMQLQTMYNPDRSCSPEGIFSQQRKEIIEVHEANPDLYMYLRPFPGPSFHPPRPESDQSIQIRLQLKEHHN
jgi:hypothetical protein